MSTQNNYGTITQRSEQSVGRSILYGAGAGVVGGIVFGMMMMMMAMPSVLPMIGKIIGIENLGGGWLYHLFNSAVIGAIFGLVLARLSLNSIVGAVAGMAYGMVWWVLGPLLLMPLMLGMSNMVFNINADSLMSLMGHLIYGVITGLGYVFLKDRFSR